MATPVIMPRQGQSVESCIFSEWFVKIGDEVKQGDLLFSYETDKAAFEAEAPEDGILLTTYADPGDAIPVLQNIGVIGQTGEETEGFNPDTSDIESSSDTNHQEEIVTEIKAVKQEDSIGATSSSLVLKISPRARKAAESLHINYTGISGSGPEGRIIEKDIVAKYNEIPKATPLAKSISYEDHVDLPETGSGTGGKVIAQDVKNTFPGISDEEFEENKITNIRRIIAENMLASLQNTAQLTLHTTADARAIKRIRAEYKKAVSETDGTNVTINDLVCYATVKALMFHTDVNAHFTGEAIRKFKNIHLGFAVDTERGLMVPTLRNANHLKLEGFAAQMKTLAFKAQSGKIDPELLTGATFTITNLGAFGIEMFTPVLNPPQVAILGINTITMQPSVLEDGSFGFIPRIGLSLTFDHRALDGAPAADFLQSVRKEIEKLK